MTAPLSDARRKQLLAAFWMPSVQTMVSRKSSMTNAFVNAVLPTRVPTPEEIDEALRILAIEPDDLRCAYCGDSATEWDHLRPLVVDRRPTGYISEIANLVPSCGKCNQSKRNEYWHTWMLSTAKRSPSGRRVAGLEERIARLAEYERWKTPLKIDFCAILGEDDWNGYWLLWETMNDQLERAQKVADAIHERIVAGLNLAAAESGSASPRSSVARRRRRK